MATTTAPRILGTVNVDDVTQAPLQVTRSLRVKATREKVFEFIADHSGWTSWFPILADVEVDNSAAQTPGGSGAVRTCTLVNGARFAENIVGYEAPAGFGYAIEDGNPLGVSGPLCSSAKRPLAKPILFGTNFSITQTHNK